MTDGPAPVVAAELVRWSWIGDHLDDIRGDLVQHVELTGLALLFGLLLAFPLALSAAVGLVGCKSVPNPPSEKEPEREFATGAPNGEASPFNP